MPQYNEYTSAAAQDTDDGDLILWEIDGVTYKMTSAEFRKVNNIAVLNIQSGTSYTLVIGDLGKTILMNNGSANTLTVSPSSDVDFPLGTQIAVWRMGAGQTTVVAGSGVTINTANDDLAISAQYASGYLLKVDTDSWVWASGGASSGSGLTQLSTPASLTMTANGEDGMDFAWDDVADESGFEAQIAEDSGFTTGLQTDNVGAGILNTSFSGLTADTTYYGRVKAEGDGTTYSDSGYATDSADTDPAGLTQLNDPTSFNATVDGSDIDLTWTDSNTSPNEVGYEILRNTSNTTVGATLINTTAANATSYTDTAPGAGTWYYFIRAKGNLTTTGHSAYVSDSATISGSSASYLTLTSSGAQPLTESPTGTWNTNPATQGWGVTTDSIPSSATTGSIEAQYASSANLGAVIGLKTAQTHGTYAEMAWGIWPSGPNYYVVNNGTFADSGVACTVGEYYRIVKTSANSAKAQRSTNGTTWIDIGSTFAYTNSAEMFGGVHVATGGNEVSELKGENFS